MTMNANKQAGKVGGGGWWVLTNLRDISKGVFLSIDTFHILLL